MRTITNDILSFALALVVLMPWAIVAGISSVSDSGFVKANAAEALTTGNASASVKVQTIVNGTTVVDIDEEYSVDGDGASVWVEVNEAVSTGGVTSEGAGRAAESSEQAIPLSDPVQLGPPGLLALLETIRLILLSYAGNLF